VGDCRAHTVAETRVREAVIPPIEALLGTLRQEDVRQAVREQIADQQSNYGQTDGTQALTERLEKMESRLSALEDAYLDRAIGKDRYLTKRDDILGQMNDIKAATATQPKTVTVDLDQLFAIADTLSVETLDDQAWREIVENMVDRVVIEGEGDGRKDPAKITVIWKPEYAPLIGR
jgi:hypothetical protein